MEMCKKPVWMRSQNFEMKSNTKLILNLIYFLFVLILQPSVRRSSLSVIHFEHLLWWVRDVSELQICYRQKLLKYDFLWETVEQLEDETKDDWMLSMCNFTVGPFRSTLTFATRKSHLMKALTIRVAQMPMWRDQKQAREKQIFDRCPSARTHTIKSFETKCSLHF